MLSPIGEPFILIALVLANLVFNILASVCFKFSANSPNTTQFLLWQVLGNIAGLITVLCLTGLLKFIPLHVAYPLTTGLAVIGVNVLAAMLFFKEAITVTQWLGTVVIVVGIVLVSK